MGSSMFRRIRRFWAYLLVKTLLSVARVLPRPVGRAAFGRLGMLAFLVLKRSRSIALVNLKLVYGQACSDHDARQLASKAFVNMGRFAFDVASMGRQTPDSIRTIVKIRGQHHLDKALAAGRGVIAVTGHIGNWELLGAYLALVGYPVNVVATTLRDSRLNDVLIDLRRSVGLSVLERSKGLRQAFRCLKRGEILGILIDQDTSVDSVIVDFLGRPAKTAVGPVKLATRTGAAVVPMAMLMREDGDYEIVVREPVRLGGNGSTLEDDVGKCSKAVEHFIRKEPCQWVWMHRRWKSVLSDIYS